MRRDLSQRPRTVRRLDGALTDLRYVQSDGFARRAVRMRQIHKCSLGSSGMGPAEVAELPERENASLFAVLLAFVEWMRGGITDAGGES